MRRIQWGGWGGWIRCHGCVWTQSSPSTVPLFLSSSFYFTPPPAPSTFMSFTMSPCPSVLTGWPPQSSLHPYDQATRQGSLAGLPTPHHQVPYQGRWGRGWGVVWVGQLCGVVGGAVVLWVGQLCCGWGSCVRGGAVVLWVGLLHHTFVTASW